MTSAASAGRRAAAMATTVVLSLLVIGTYIAVRHPGASPAAAADRLTSLPDGAGAGAPAYRFSIVDLQGRTHRLADYAGQPLLVTFFNTSCPPCVHEASALEELQKRFAGRVSILAVAVADTRAAASSFAQRHEWTMPVGLDPGYRLTHGFAVFGTPTTVVLDRRGAVAATLPGEVTVPRLTALLDRLLS